MARRDAAAAQFRVCASRKNAQECTASVALCYLLCCMSLAAQVCRQKGEGLDESSRHLALAQYPGSLVLGHPDHRGLQPPPW